MFTRTLYHISVTWLIVFQELVLLSVLVRSSDTHICYKLTGPEVVYDIKCLLDELLDTVENISDVLINSIRPLLALCSQDTLKVACKSGLSLLGICI